MSAATTARPRPRHEGIGRNEGPTIAEKDWYHIESMRAFRRAGSFALLALAGGACSDDAPPRAQWLLVLDTTAPLVDDLRRDATLSADLAVDTLRIDILAARRDGPAEVTESRVIVAPSPESFPLSLGIVPDGDHGALVRVRLFRGALAATGRGPAGETVTDPFPETTIDRLVHLGSATGVPVAKVVLDADCLGVPSSFGEVRRTCLDGGTRSGDPADGIVVTADAPQARFASVVPFARAAPCGGAAPKGAVCVPGGFTVLGDRRLEGFSEGGMVPLRPVLLSPFFLDETEFTVGRFRALVASGKLKTAPPKTRLSTDIFRADCTWTGAADGSADALPLNCISVASAEAACAAEGGTLPSEAEWEHAARGRGERRSYPWGEEAPSCCTASVSRENPVTTLVLCKGRGPEAAGSHRPTAGCPGGGDLSRDGVSDLGGSLAEVLRDKFRPYESNCLGPSGIARDPVCADPAAPFRVRRGGEWSAGTLIAMSALRHATVGDGDNVTGFRCRYPGTP